MDASESRTSTIMHTDVSVDGDASWAVGIANANNGHVLDADAVGTVVAFGSVAAGVAAGKQLQQTAVRLGLGPVRVGLAAGDVSWSNGTCTGAAIATAAALVAHAQPGQILADPIVRLLAGTEAAVSLGTLDVEPDAPMEVFAVEWRSSNVDDRGTTDPPVVPLPAGIATAQRQLLVGREPEWNALHEAWDRATGGGREVVLIGGEAGAGKTRLAIDFARHCHAAGGIVLLGSCDAELTLPYQPWVHALDHLLRSLPGYGRAFNADRDLGDLIVLLPQLEPMLPGLSKSVAADPETERYLLFSAVDRVLASSAQLAPVLLLLDDLHWAGRQTLELLRHLVRSGTASRLMVVATFRDSTADLSEPLSECLADLQRSESVTRLRVGGLDTVSVERYVSNALGQDLDADLRRLAAVARDRSGGNAFFLGELWRHLLHHGVVVRSADRWVVHRDIAGVGSPDSVRDVVAARMARLSRPARRLLELAATAGQRFELRVLSRAADVDTDDASTVLDELVDTGFVVPVGSRPPTYQFTHALVRDTVEEVTASSARARLHLRVGEALEDLHVSDLRAFFPELAHHFGSAAGVGGADKAVRFGRLAAEQAKASGAYDEAIAQLTAVLELLPDDSAEATAVLIDLGQIQMRHGQFVRSQETYRLAFDRARSGGHHDLAARAAVGFEESMLQPGAPGAPAVAMVAEAIRLVGDRLRPLRARLEASRARSLYLAGDLEAAVASSEVALRMARAVGDPECLMVALQCTTLLSSDPVRKLETGAELRDVATQLGEYWHVAYATAHMVRDLIELGRLGEAAQVLEQQLLISERGRFVVFQFMSCVYQAILALAGGRFADAEDAATRAHAIGESSNTAFDAGVYGLQMFAIRREQGRLAEVLPVMQVLSDRNAEQSLWRPGLAVLYAELGMLDEARRELDALSANGFAGVPRDSLWPACLAFLAESCVRCGVREHATTLMEELDAFAGRNLMVAMTACFGPADRLRAGLSHLLGRDDEAETRFAAAMALADRSESPVWRAHVLLDWSRFAATRGDSVRRGELAAAAGAIGVALGMRVVAREAEELLNGADSPVTTTATVDGLSLRELDVLRLIAAGCSNREIGERLFISQHTAANHVRSILQKCGCANRAEAAAYAVRHDLVSQQRFH